MKLKETKRIPRWRHLIIKMVKLIRISERVQKRRKKKKEENRNRKVNSDLIINRFQFYHTLVSCGEAKKARPFCY